MLFKNILVLLGSFAIWAIALGDFFNNFVFIQRIWYHYIRTSSFKNTLIHWPSLPPAKPPHSIHVSFFFFSSPRQFSILLLGHI